MSEFEDKLNTILTNPEAMGQIMELARSLGGKREPQPEPEHDVPPAPAPPAGEGLLGGLGGLDPRLLEVAGRFMTAYQAGDDDRAALLTALRPFVRAERYARLDQAIRVSRLTRAIRAALDALRAGEGGTGRV